MHIQQQVRLLSVLAKHMVGRLRRLELNLDIDIKKQM